MFPGTQRYQSQEIPTLNSESVCHRKLQGTFRNLENKLGVNKHPLANIITSVTVTCKDQKNQISDQYLPKPGRTKFTFVSFGQEIARQGRGHLKINLTAPLQVAVTCTTPSSAISLFTQQQLGDQLFLYLHLCSLTLNRSNTSQRTFLLHSRDFHGLSLPGCH